jgi:hypothetical protein
VQDAYEQVEELDLKLLNDLLEAASDRKGRDGLNESMDDASTAATAMESISEEMLLRASSVLKKLTEWMQKPPVIVLPMMKKKESGGKIYHTRPSSRQKSSFFLNLMNSVGLDGFTSTSKSFGTITSEAASENNDAQHGEQYYCIKNFTDDLDIVAEALDYLYIHSYKAKHTRSKDFVDYSHASIDELSRCFKLLTVEASEAACERRFATSYNTILLRGSCNYNPNSPELERSYDLTEHSTIKLAYYPSAEGLRGFGQRSMLLMSGSLIDPLKSTAELSEASSGKQFRLIKNASMPAPAQFTACVNREFTFTKTNLMSNNDNETSTSLFISTAESLLQYTKLTPGGILVCFPSFHILSIFIAKWRMKNGTERSYLEQIESMTSVIIEKQASDSSSSNAKEALRDHKNKCEAKRPSMILAVARGKFTEGADYVGNHCRMMVVIGIPLMPAEDPELLNRQAYLNTKIRNKQQVYPSGQDFYISKSMEPILQVSDTGSRSGQRDFTLYLLTN